jgi:hypothetical protein
MKKILIVAAVMLLMLSTVAFADTVTFTTAPGAKESGGNNVSASATVTTGNGTVTVVITNLIVDPTTVAQNVSDFAFTLSSGQTTGSITSVSGVQRTVASNGTFTDAAYTSYTQAQSGWSNTGLHFTALGGGSPFDTILGKPNGSNVYGSAGGSIAGNGPHNPFLAGPVTFVLSVPGVNADSHITSFTERLRVTTYRAAVRPLSQLPCSC